MSDEQAWARARIDGFEAVTREYSRYAESAGGIASIAGGALCLLSFALGAAFEATPALRSAMVAIPFAWLTLKLLVARHYYQRLGRVDELRDPSRDRTRAWLLGGVAAIVAVVVLGALPGTQASRGSPLATAAYLGLLVALPIVAWRWLRAPIDLAVGTFLFCQAALAASGRGYQMLSTGIVFVPAALLMIAGGIRDHRRFGAIEQRMRALAGPRVSP